MPVPPDPSIPGLLDLLTVRALGEPPPDEAAEADHGHPRREERPELERRRAPVPRLRSMSPNRGWVEVEV